MATYSRWLHWKPENADAAQLTGDKTAKSDERGKQTAILSAVSPVSSPKPASALQPAPLSGVPPFCDHAPYAEEFSRWALADCLFHDGCLWSVAAFHLRFCEWRIAEGTVGCMLATFAALLRSEGFTLGSTTTAGMVYGLVLKAEYLALTAPEPGRKPRRS